MSIPRSRELSAVVTQARDIARKSGRSLTTAHLLLSLFTVPNRAAVFLEDRSITVDSLLKRLQRFPDERSEMMDRVHDRAHRIARGSQSEAVNSLHLLAALVRESRSHAHRLLDEAGANISAIRASVMSYATGSRSLPRRFYQGGEEESEETAARVSAPAVAREASREHAPSPIGFHPSLGIGTGRRRGQVQTIAPPGDETRESQQHSDDEGRSVDSDEPAFLARSTSRHSQTATSVKNTPADASEIDVDVDDGSSPEPGSTETEETSAPEKSEAEEEARRTARKLAEALFKKRKEALKARDDRRESEEPPADDSGDIDQQTPTETDDTEGRDDAVEAPSFQTDPPTPLTTARGADPSPLNEPDVDLAEAYALDPDDYPHLTKYGRNLTRAAALGKIDRVIGRDREVLQLIDIIGKRRSNNPILIGEAGVGKTAIVEGLAREFVELAHRDDRLGKRAVIELEVGRIIGGTHLRGSFSERLMGIKEEVRKADGDVIVFLDEIHSWMNAGAGGDGTDAAGELKTALARGEFPCIGATTNDEFRKFVETDPAFERRFEVVFVDEPDIETTHEILHGIRSHYEAHHEVTYEDDALEASVRLSHRFIHERRLPDKAVGVLDLAGSRAARTGESAVSRSQIAEIVADLAGIPAERLTRTDRDRFLNMEEYLSEGIVGHTDIVSSVSEVIRRNYAGFGSNRPIGSLLFLGPTGVGKTELVKVLADFLFFDRDAIVRLDMSEFMEAHSISRMIGSPPGYVGHDQGGQLTEAVRRRPYQIVLLDEIEKAHPDILNILLQLLDEGRLTDGRGRTVDFSNCVVVMTSNLGSDIFEEMPSAQRPARIGFSERESRSRAEDVSDDVLEAARSHFPPELWNRIDERLVFQPLSRSEVARIAALQLRRTATRLKDENDIVLVCSDAVIQHLVEHGGFDPKLGARPMRQTIERLIESGVARLVLSGEATRGDTVYADVDSGELRLYAEE